MREPHKPTIDRCSIDNATARAKHYADVAVERARQVTEDHERAERLAACECPMCYKGSRIGGAAMTRSLCGICCTEMVFGNTCTDNLCLECAKSNLLCKRCGGDIDMKIRRKPRPLEMVEESS